MPSARSAAPSAERRLVSVLFADLVGFTPFAEERDAEEVRDTLTRYFELASDVINRYGGTVEKFIGDAVMAVWGAPTAHEDDAERAVRAALELVDAVRALGPTIQARAGVLTGEAAVTLGATNQGLVAGDLVNTAARLQSVAPPGAVLVGEATHRAASAAIAFEEAGEQALKGKTAPVPAWRALRVVAERGGRNRSEALEAPFVGRDDELRLLKDLFHATAREGRIRLVSVIGPAGIGKSRLAWEFLKYIDGLVDTVYWHDGRSPAYGEGITFWALGEMVRGRAGLLEGDDEPTTRAKVAEAVSRWVTDPDERRWIEPALLALLGIESAVSSEQLFAAWRTFFERVAVDNPVVMVFEDFHFADSGLLDFVDHLMDWSRGAPIYVVTLSRPELIERRPEWGAGKRNFSSLHLDPLSEPAMRELIGGLVPGLPEQAVRAIVERADGIPLYAIETVRMLVADGRLAQSDGTYVPTGDLTSLAVPESLTALISARLDGLDPVDRGLAQDAAVLGQSFTTAGLSAVSGIDADELEPRLRGLVRRELVTLQADPRSPERGQYAFVQALIREVAYNTLARRDRKARHLAAARFFESLGTDELAGALASHYLAAHANSGEGAEADALATQARIALSAAAQRAADLGAHDQAIAFLEQAVAVAADPVDRGALLDRAAQSAGLAAHQTRAEEFARQAVEINEQIGNVDGVALAAARLGQAMIWGRRIEESIPILETALAREAELGDLARATVLAVLAQASFRTKGGDLKAVAMADRALAISEPARLDRITAEALVNKGSALSGLGRPKEAVALMRAAAGLAHELGATLLELRALNNLGGAQFFDDPLGSWQSSMELLELSERVGNRAQADWILWDGAFFRFMTAKDWDGWLSRLEDRLAEGLDDQERAAFLMGTLYFRVARGEDVGAMLAATEVLVRSITDPYIASGWRYVLGLKALADGDSRRALELTAEDIEQDVGQSPTWHLAARAALWAHRSADLRKLIDLLAAAPHSTAVLTQASLVTARAGLAALDGHADEALALYRESMRALDTIEMDFLRALAGLDMAIFLDPGLREVQAAAAEARAIFERVGARPFLTRLDEAMTRSSAAAADQTVARDDALSEPVA